MIDLAQLPISAEQARAARSYLGMSQAKAAELSGLASHVLKRFEAPGKPGSVYVPDEGFLRALRSFYEDRGYPFEDTPEPGAKAKAAGQVFPAGVVGQDENSDSPPRRTAKTAFHHMRIAITDEAEMGRVLDLIEDNEQRAEELLQKPIEAGFFGGLTEESQANHVEALKLLAENGKLFARLFGREIGGKPADEVLAGASKPRTHAELMHQRQADVHLIANGDRDAAARRRSHKPAPSLMSALFG